MEPRIQYAKTSDGVSVAYWTLGKGIMAVFTSARQAIDAAVRCRDLGNEARLPLRARFWYRRRCATWRGRRRACRSRTAASTR